MKIIEHKNKNKKLKINKWKIKTVKNITKRNKKWYEMCKDDNYDNDDI